MTNPQLEKLIYSHIHKNWSLVILYFFTSLVCTQALPVYPLSTNSRWIVDQEGTRVKLACINWVGHLEPMIPEGLSKQSLCAIVSRISATGFNCVRLTSATWLWTNETLGTQSVEQSLQSLGLNTSLQGVKTNNPELLGLNLRETFLRVVAALKERDLMVLLDNHVSRPGWCCWDTDGNGFWGDKYFDLESWKTGLKVVATTFKNCSNVVAMSLRNELRGGKSNQNDWYKYIQQGGDIVRSANPDLLIVVGGLGYATDLSFLKAKQLGSSLRDKLVYEVHWYSWFSSLPYSDPDLNKVCAADMKRVENGAGFVISEGQAYTGPLIVSEWGVDESQGIGGKAEGRRMFKLGDAIILQYLARRDDDQKYSTCALAYLAKHDLDWALWTLPGSYYVRSGQEDIEETYALLTKDWRTIRSPDFLARLHALQSPMQGPGITTDSSVQVILHPLTGLCVSTTLPSSRALQLLPCQKASRWTWKFGAGHIQLLGPTTPCINFIPDASSTTQVQLTESCGERGTKWQKASAAQMQISTQVGNDTLCLETSGNEVTVADCLCLSGCASALQDPSNQLFEFILAPSLF